LTLSRSERRRLDREIAKIEPQEGVGLGWRRSAGWRGNKYPVKEPPNVSLEALIAESQAVYVRLYPKRLSETEVEAL